MAEEEKDIQDDVQDDIQEDTEVQKDVQENIQEENKVGKRIRELSNKVKLTSREKDELSKLNKTLEKERDEAVKEKEFYSAFSDATDKYPIAKEFKDAIKQKVLGGYSVEDATVSVLAKEGKLTAPQNTDSPAGGSAINSSSTGEPKSLSEMTREEKREEIEKAFERGELDSLFKR